jgi:hypothetical protein
LSFPSNTMYMYIRVARPAFGIVERKNILLMALNKEGETSNVSLRAMQTLKLAFRGKRKAIQQVQDEWTEYGVVLQGERYRAKEQ